MPNQKTPARLRIAPRHPLRVVSPDTQPPPSLVWLDLANETLRDGHQPLPLEPKAFAVLRYLHARPQQLVTKHEMMEAVWTGTIVTDGVLTNCIAAIRSALRETIRAPRYIETVHRRGYRWLTPLHTTAPSTNDPPTVHEPLALATQSRASETLARPGEYRHLTVLSCEVVGSTALSTRLDPEAYHTLIRDYLQRCLRPDKSETLGLEPCRWVQEMGRYYPVGEFREVGAIPI